MSMHTVAAAGAAALLAAGGSWAQGDTFPGRPLRVITGFAAGGVSDVIARATGAQLSAQLGQPVLMDVRPGAGGTLSMSIAAAAQPDGHTLYLATPTVTLSPLFTERKLGLDPFRAFAPVSLIGTGPTVLTVTPRLPVKTVSELVAYGKTRPGGLRVGHSGEGSIQHLAGELYRVRTGAEVTPIAYRSGQASMVAVLQGEVDFSFVPLSSALPHMEAGRLRALGVTSAKRARAVPEVPAIAETLPGFDVFSWYGLLVPAAVPRPILNRLNAELRRALEAATLRDVLERQGLEVQASTPEAFGQLMREDHRRWASLVKDAGIVLR